MFVGVDGCATGSVGIDDVVDAAVSAWSARRIARGEARSVPDPYRGQTGAVWLTRLLPDPRDATRAVSWTTPYEIRSPGEEELRGYLERAVPSASRGHAYHDHMKRGPSLRYWHEYVFEGYAGHEPGVIFLEGLPDRAETRPHSPEYVRTS